MKLGGKLEAAAMLIDVQRARKFAAEMALASARDAERGAQQEEQEARCEALLAHGDWLDHVSLPGFSPEISMGLSTRLIEREQAVEAAALNACIASDLRMRRQQEWQLSDCQTRSSQTAFRKLQRKARRRREEKQLGELADRATYLWIRP